MSNFLKVTNSTIERELGNENPKYKRYEADLKSMDKNGDGQIDINELCEKIDEMAQLEKQRRLLKWASIITALFALLTIAAVVGLVYVVVVKTKDTSVSSSGILTTTDTAATPIATGQAINLDSIDNLYTKSLDDLAKISFLILPDASGGRVVHVAEIELIANTSATITTDAGNVYIIDASGVHEKMANQTRMRKLLDTTDGQTGSSATSIIRQGRRVRMPSCRGVWTADGPDTACSCIGVCNDWCGPGGDDNGKCGLDLGTFPECGGAGCSCGCEKCSRPEDKEPVNCAGVCDECPTVCRNGQCFQLQPINSCDCGGTWPNCLGGCVCGGCQ